MEKKLLEIRKVSQELIPKDNYYTIRTPRDLKVMKEHFENCEIIAVDTETTGVNVFIDIIVGVSLFAQGKGWYIPLRHYEEIILSPELSIPYIKELLESEKKFVLHNAKFDVHVLYNNLGIELKPYVDTMVMAKLMDENKPGSLKELSGIYLKEPADKFEKLFGKVTFDRVPLKLATHYAIKDTEMTLRLFEYFDKFLKNPALKQINDLIYKIEMPYLDIVTKSERKGVKFDLEYIKKEVEPTLLMEINELLSYIKSVLGDINLKSPKQLSKAIYEDLKLTPVNKKKPNSTDKMTMNKLKSQHSVIVDLLSYRQKTKLFDAFVNALPEKIVNGRLHTSFNTVGAKTGRISSNSPNLQQIPAGDLIRKAFIADEGRLLASIDFSGQELRLLSEITGDEVLINAFVTGKDIHSLTATKIYNSKYNKNITYEEFEFIRKGSSQEADTMEQVRKKAKSVNFGVVYGISETGLSEQLQVTKEEAKSYIDGFFNLYTGVADWVKATEQQILKQKYVSTLLGRKRRLYEEVNSGDKYQLCKAIRMGCNSQIQGAAADQTKLASILLQPLLEQLDSQILLFVHDELIIDVPKNIGTENLKRMAKIMCDAIPLKCGMKSDIEVGYYWTQKLKEDELDWLHAFEEEE